MEKSVQTKFAHFLMNYGIVIGTYVPGLEITEDIAIQIVKDRIIFFENKSYPLLIDASKVRSINYEARKYFESEEGKTGILAAALLVGNKYTMMLGNFFLNITYKSRSFPARLFTSKEKALQWLEQFKKQ